MVRVAIGSDHAGLDLKDTIKALLDRLQVPCEDVGTRSHANRVAIAEVGSEPIYSITGEVTEILSSKKVAEALRQRGRDAAAFEGIEEMIDWVVAGRREGDVVLVMSNGAFGGIWEKLLEALARAA